MVWEGFYTQTMFFIKINTKCCKTGDFVLQYTVFCDKVHI